MVNGLDVPVAVSAPAVPVSVSPVVAVLILIALNVATPEAVLAVFPDAIVPDDTASVIVRPLSVVTRLPNWSCTWTVTAGAIDVAVATSEGCWANASLLGAAA